MFFTDPKTHKTYCFTHCLLKSWGKQGHSLTLFKKNGDMEVVSADTDQAHAAVNAAHRRHCLFIDDGTCPASDLAYLVSSNRFKGVK